MEIQISKKLFVFVVVSITNQRSELNRGKGKRFSFELSNLPPPYEQTSMHLTLPHLHSGNLLEITATNNVNNGYHVVLTALQLSVPQLLCLTIILT